MSVYIARFPFGPTNTYLQAEVNPITRKQTLSIIRQDPKTGEIEVINTMKCIHTVVSTLSIDEFENIGENPDKKEAFLKDTVKLRARKPPELIRDDFLLDLDEQFFAFKSWVQGIAEAGIDVIFLNVQGIAEAEIDFTLLNVDLINRFLLWAFLYNDPDFIFQYFNKIVKECRFEGALHKASLWANLDVLTYAIDDLIKKMAISDSYVNEYIRLVYELDAEYIFHFLNSFDWDIKSDLAGRFLEFVAAKISVKEQREKLPKGINRCKCCGYWVMDIDDGLCGHCVEIQKEKEEERERIQEEEEWERERRRRYLKKLEIVKSVTKRYLKNPKFCLFCNSEKIQAVSLVDCGDHALQRVACQSCGKDWWHFLAPTGTKRYLENLDFCPFCNSEEILTLDMVDCGDHALQKIVCESCGKDWSDKLTLTGMFLNPEDEPHEDDDYIDD